MGRRISEEERDEIYKIYLHCAKASRKMNCKPGNFSCYVLQRTSAAAGVSPRVIARILQEKRKTRSMVTRDKRSMHRNSFRRRILKANAAKRCRLHQNTVAKRCVHEESEAESCREEADKLEECIPEEDTSANQMLIKNRHEDENIKIGLKRLSKANIQHVVIIDGETGSQVRKLTKFIDFRQVHANVKAQKESKESNIRSPGTITFLSHVVYDDRENSKNRPAKPILKKIIHIQLGIKMKQAGEKAMSLFDHLGLPPNIKTEKEIMKYMEIYKYKFLPIIVLKRRKAELSDKAAENAE